MKLSATTSIIFIANTFLPANGTGVFAGFYSPTTNFRLNSLGRIHIKQMQIIVWLIMKVRQTMVVEVHMD
jgi:hypothetical protein